MAKGYHPFRRRSSDPVPERNNNSSSETPSATYNMNSLRRGLTLPLHEMAIPIYTVPSREDVEVGGRALFQHFIEEQLVNEGISEEVLDVQNPPPDAFGDVGPEMLQSESNVESQAEPPTLARTPTDVFGFKNSRMKNIGKNIRTIADEFAKSHHRSLIRAQADEVDLSHIDQSTYYDMLCTLFENGIDQYRVVAVFFFCSDVLIRCVKKELHNLGSKLFFWALDFLIKKVCKWIHDKGGWEKAFTTVYNVVYQAVVFSAFLVVIGCGCTYIKNNYYPR